VVFPHEQVDTNTGRRVLHNRCRVLIFPDAETVKAAMKEASPNIDPMAISRENGFNKNQADGSLANEIGADWFKFQEALGKRGYMGIVDIEGKKSNAHEQRYWKLFRSGRRINTLIGCFENWGLSSFRLRINLQTWGPYQSLRK